MESSTIAVVTDGLRFSEACDIFESHVSNVVEWPQDLVEAGDLLERLYDEGTKRFVVFGEDELVGRMVTAYRRRRTLGAEPMEVWPLDVGEAFVARQHGRPVGASRAVKLLRKGVDDWHRSRVGTIKVTASTQQAAWYGFSFGAGWVYRAQEARKRARGGAGNFVSAFGRLATETLGDEEDRSVAERVAIDHQPAGDQGGSFVVSTLAKTVFGLGADGDGAVLWDRVPLSRLMRRAVTPELLENKTGEGRRFETIHLDSPDGWLLDGRLHGTQDPAVVQVVPGPTMTLIRPVSGLKAMVRGLWN